MRWEQPSVAFDFHDGVMDVSSWNLEAQEISGIPITLSPHVHEILDRLVAQPIT